jgi:hypothetical protein
MSRLEVGVALTRRLDATGASVDLLQVTARNFEAPITLSGCAVLLPLGLRIYSGPSELEYPFVLDTGAQCSDFFDCRAVAAQARDFGCSGRVRLEAMFVESPGLVVSSLIAPAAAGEHRSGSFTFEVDRWP